MQNSPERKYEWGPMFMATVGFAAFTSLTGILILAVAKVVF
jgi:hypothetical protein